MEQAFFSSSDPLLAELSVRAKEGNFPHTLLLIGPEGSGRHALAEGIAALLLCPAHGEHNDPESCPVCRKLLHKSHPDFIRVEAENKSGTLSLAQLRDRVIATLPIFPHEGEKKIYFCAAPLMPAAQNLLLKSLEEPPSHTVFLLLGNRETDFLDTVLSRGVSLRLTPKTPEELAKMLPKAKENPWIHPLSGGWPGQAAALDEESIQKILAFAEQLLSALLSHNEYAFLVTLEQMEKAKCAREVYRCVIHLLRGSLSLEPPVQGNLSALQENCRRSFSAAKRRKLLLLCLDMLAPLPAGRNAALHTTAFAAACFS